MDSAQSLLNSFLSQRNVRRISADLPVLASHAEKSDAVTDVYLAELAARHEMKLATLDENIRHPAATVI
jgi:hypothetical protein